ncbi:MAG: hypothetical protein WAK90_20240 [Pseudolabrys sp.]
MTAFIIAYSKLILMFSLIGTILPYHRPATGRIGTKRTNKNNKVRITAGGLPHPT